MPFLQLLDELKAKLAEFEVVFNEEKAASFKAGYDQGKLEGYNEGKLSVVLPPTGTGEALFTQEDMDRVALVAKEEVTGVLQPQIDGLQAELKLAQDELVEVKGKLVVIESGVAAQVEAGVAAGVAAFKADLLAKYEAQQVAETEGETGFKNFLA